MFKKIDDKYIFFKNFKLFFKNKKLKPEFSQS